MGNRSSSIYIVGAVPPPIGGISVHIDRLVHRLVETGYKVEIFDYSGIKKVIEANGANAIVWSGSIIQVFTKLCMRVIFSRPLLIHWHISIGNRFFKISYLAWLFARLVPTIVTIHASPISDSVERTSVFFKVGLNRFFKSIKGVITVNQAVGPYIARKFKVPDENIYLIPAYLPAAHNTSIDASYKGSSESCIDGSDANRKIVGTATGYGIPLYWWEGLLAAIQQCERVVRWNLVFYSTYEEPYFGGLVTKIDEINRYCSAKVRIYRDLPQREFLQMLSSSDLFVRPTLTDGDSLALREALSLGLAVIASDVVARPSGCVLFRGGDVNDLLSKIETHDRHGHIEPEEKDYFVPVLKVYEKAILSNAKQ